jgi:shikimate dehydrogenase
MPEMAHGSPRFLTAGTRLCAVFGQPIRHSASPSMHNAAFDAVGLDWAYAACEVDPKFLGEALAGARRMGFCGLNLTVPHKLEAIEWVDELDESAKAWGAVNTVVFEAEVDGEWIPVGQVDPTGRAIRSKGYNTDADALIRALKEDLRIEPRSARVLLLGAGGAARAAALKLADEGVLELWLVNRTLSKAEELAAEISHRYPAVTIDVGYPESDVEIILNGTSLGLKPTDPLPLDTERFPLERADGVYDMIYRPAVTPLLAAAHAAGCQTANGLGMLLYQGAAAWELWTGRPAPIDVMREALGREVYGGPR